MRLAAMMQQRVIYVFTHDSIALGEDGTTHQPVEQLANLRAVPRLVVIRPCDANETAYAWRVAIEIAGPSSRVDPDSPGCANAGPQPLCLRPPS